MPDRPFDSTADFAALFDLSPPYDNFAPLRDGLGFRVTRPYPTGVGFVPARSADGHIDTVAVIRAIYAHSQESNTPVDVRRVPLTFKIQAGSLAGLATDERWPNPTPAPTAESLRASRASLQPIPLMFSDYVFDHSTGVFRRQTGETLSGTQVLTAVFEKHCDSVRTFRGLRMRFKHRLYSTGPIRVMSALLSIQRVLVVTLRVGFGRTLNEKTGRYPYDVKYVPADLQVQPAEVYSFQAYKGSRNSIFTFSFLFVVAAILWKLWKPQPNALVRALRELMQNNLFMACFALASLALFDGLLPLVLLWSVNAVGEMQRRLFAWVILHTREIKL